MHYIELLKASNKDFKVKFISIMKDKCFFNTKKLSSLYDTLLDSKKVIIEFRELDFDSLNDIVFKLMELDINIGDSSFHEELPDRADMHKR